MFRIQILETHTHAFNLHSTLVSDRIQRKHAHGDQLTVQTNFLYLDIFVYRSSCTFTPHLILNVTLLLFNIIILMVVMIAILPPPPQEEKEEGGELEAENCRL